MPGRDGPTLVGARVALFFCLALLGWNEGLGAGNLDRIDESIWRQALRLGGVDVSAGVERLRMLIFFDPDCPYCADLWVHLQTLGSPMDGVRWVPVAYYDSSSRARAATILSGSHSAASLDLNFRRYDRSTRSGAAALMSPIPESLAGSIKRNTAFWAGLGAMTPLILYRKKNGEVWRFQGSPDHSSLAEIDSDIAPAELDSIAKP